MNKTFAWVAAILLVGMFLSGGVWAGEKAPQKVIDLGNGKLAQFGKDPIIVKAVKAQNAGGLTLEAIKKRDEEWKAAPGMVDYMKALMDSECGLYIQKLTKNDPYLIEIFVMDNQGANVAMSDKTSDYWQGDETKWINSFKNGEGGLDVSEVSFDDSTQAYIVQVSVPVMDEGKAIGAITFGIDLDKIE